MIEEGCVVTTEDAERLRGKAILAALILAAASYAAFALSWNIGAWIAPLSAPVFLWYGNQWLLVGLRMLAAGEDYMSRVGKTEWFALAAAMPVGAWVAFTQMPLYALAPLCLAGLVDGAFRQRTIPKDSEYVPVSIIRWIAFITSGQFLGYLLAALWLV
jgi:hypothetical protein